MRSSLIDYPFGEYTSSGVEVSGVPLGRRYSQFLCESIRRVFTRGKRVASFVEYKVTSALKGFKLQASESMDVVDKLTAIDLKAATSAGEIATGLAQFANVGSLAGVTLDEAAAYVATIADVTQMGGSSAG